MVGRVAAVGTLVAEIAGGATGADPARFAPRLRVELVRYPTTTESRGASGSYGVRAPGPRRGGTLALQARLPSRLARGGERTVDAPAGCTSSTLAGVTTNVLAVRLR